MLRQVMHGRHVIVRQISYVDTAAIPDVAVVRQLIYLMLNISRCHVC